MKDNVMSMCGELENLDREIDQAKIKLESLQRRRDDLQRLIDEDKNPKLDMHLDPSLRNWEYDGYGNKVPKGYAE